MSETINPKKQACTDVLSFHKGKISKEEFMASYKAHAGKYLDYAHTVEDLMLSDMNGHYNRYDFEPFAKECDISEADGEELLVNQQYYQQKLVDALFDIAYTRTPNNERGGDGKPMSYDRKYNIGVIAERALLSLSHIKETDTGAMPHLRNAWAYPRLGSDYKVSDGIIIESVRIDQQSCFRANQERIAKFCTKFNS